MGCVTISKASLDAGMPLIRLAVLVRHHADDAVALHFGLERAADATIGAGRHLGMVWLAVFDDRFLGERRCRAGLHARPAGNALGPHEIRRAGRDAALETTALDRQREGALNLLAGANAAVADDAFGGIVGEIRVRLVLGVFEVIFAIIAVTHLPQADGPCHVLQLAVAIGRAGEAIERVVGDVKLHHALAQLRKLFRLCPHRHAFFDKRRAGGRRSPSTRDFNEAQAARAEWLDRIRRTKLRDLGTEAHGGGHDGSTLRNTHGDAVDRQRHLLFRNADRRAVINFLDQAGLRPALPHQWTASQHRTWPVLSYSAASGSDDDGLRKSSGKFFSAESTGTGVNPPMAHSEALVISAQRSSTSASCRSASSPASTLSMSSTPRVAPIRQGVHLPQLSLAQNAKANRAWRARSTVSSKTTMPPWPSRPPAFAIAS